MRKKGFLLFVVLLCIALFPVLGMGNEERHQHEGEKEISFSGYLTSGEETNWTVSLAGGYFFNDTMMIGAEIYLGSSESSETIENDEGNEIRSNSHDIIGIVKGFFIYHFTTCINNSWEPFIGIQAGVTVGDEGQFVAGTKTGFNYYFSDDFGFSIGYEPLWLFEDEELEHNFAVELFYQFD